MDFGYGDCADLWNGGEGDGVQGRVVQQVGFLPFICSTILEFCFFHMRVFYNMI
jgi:hypothetical protein